MSLPSFTVPTTVPTAVGTGNSSTNSGSGAASSGTSMSAAAPTPTTATPAPTPVALAAAPTTGHEATPPMHHTQQTHLSPPQPQPQAQQAQQHQSPHSAPPIQRVRLQELPFVRRVVSICLWQSPLSSGLTLLCAALLTFLLQRGYTLLTLLSYLLMLQLLTCFFFINASKFILKLKGQEASGGATTKGARPIVGGAPVAAAPVAATAPVEYVSESTLQSLVPLVHSTLNVLLGECMALIRCADNGATLRVILALLGLSLLGRAFDGVTVAAMAVLAALTIPKAYMMNREAADRALAQAAAATDKLWLVLGTKTHQK